MSDLRTASRAPRAVWLVALALGSTSCTTLDRAVGAVPWFTTMRDQPAVRPFEGPADSTGRAPRFLPPEGSVPVTGREDSLSIYEPAGLRITDALHNPVRPTEASLARGGKIFGTYCGVCHGPQGRGDGPVAGRLGYVPDLTLDVTRQRSDGYIYAVLRHGRGVMPRYGDKIRDASDRWNVVNYLRSLQGAPAR
jgi:mono/diheme cytochrome c family protein